MICFFQRFFSRCPSDIRLKYIVLVSLSQEDAIGIFSRSIDECYHSVCMIVSVLRDSTCAVVYMNGVHGVQDVHKPCEHCNHKRVCQIASIKPGTQLSSMLTSRVLISNSVRLALQFCRKL